MSTDILIRPATEADAQALLDIYAPYVIDTAITFEYEAPTVAEFARRIGDILQKYPYLVAVRQGQTVGYAYASPLKNRAAYDWAVETTIYLEQGCRGGGVGRALYQALEQELARRNILNLYACIATSQEQDAHLSDASVRFHERMGYRQAGYFNRCGYKFGRWYDVVWMEKLLGEHTPNPKPVLRT